MMDEILYLNKQFTREEVDELREIIRNEPTGVIVPGTIPVKELKHKKGIPTVIEYKDRRYVLDNDNN